MISIYKFLTTIAVLPLGLAGCAVAVPTTPWVVAAPGAEKPPDRFYREAGYCRRYAYDQTRAAQSAAAAAGQSTATAFEIGAVGAATGALVGSLNGQFGAGMLIGAAIGLLKGISTADRQAYAAGMGLQYSYDVHYLQCMATYGNRPVAPRG